MTATVSDPIRRILLALDNGNENAGLLEASLGLAARLDAELAALFVEDEELLRLAALPFAHELSLSSGSRRPLRDRDLERTLRRRAERSEAELAAAATRVQARWSFRVTRGPVASRLSEAALECDLVTFSLGGDPLQLFHRRMLVRHTLTASARPVLLLPASAELRPPFVVVFDGGDAAYRALRLAARLSGREPGAVRVLLSAAPGGRLRLRAVAEALLTEMGMPGEFRILPALTAADLARAVRREQAGTLLLPATGELLGAERTGRLPGDFGCATLLVP